MTDTPKVDTAKLMADTKAKAAAETPAETPVIPATPVVTPPVTKPSGDGFQQFSCVRQSTCLITPTGKRVNFTDYEYYTKDQEIIDYLKQQIEAGLRIIKVGAVVSAEDINPAAALKRKHIKEFLESQEGRDYTAVSEAKKLVEEGKTAGAGTGAVNTTGVAS